MELSIPANTSATVHLPVRDVAQVAESSKAIPQTQGVSFLGLEEGNVVLRVESGQYAITIAAP